MKKILCIILICLILPLTSILFVGCKNDSYDLKTFYTSYENIVKNTPYLTLVNTNDICSLDVSSKKITIDYNKASDLKTASSSSSSSSSYKYIDSLYQQLLDDTLTPLYFFGPKIASSNRVSKDQTKQLFEQLKALEYEYQELDYYIGILNSSLFAIKNSTINLSHLKKVLLQYENLLTVAGNLSSSVSNIYFNTILLTSDFDYSSKKASELTSPDLIKMSVSTRDKMYYFKSVYANIYHQLFIKTITNQITSSSSSSYPELHSYKPHTYTAGVRSLTPRDYDSLVNISSTMENIHSYSISLFNIQKTFEAAYAEFNFATSKISYANPNPKSSNEEKNYRKIIDRFAYGIAIDSYEVLKNLTTLLYS